MKFLMSITLVVSLTTVAMALMCQFPHCELVDCAAVEAKDCKGTIKRGGGYCGCCEACFITLYEGDPCTIQDGLDSILYPSTENCAYGLYCAGNASTTAPECVRSPYYVG